MLHTAVFFAKRFALENKYARRCLSIGPMRVSASGLALWMHLFRVEFLCEMSNPLSREQIWKLPADSLLGEPGGI